MTSPTSFAYDRALLQLGMLLFLIGLLTGFAVPLLAIPRMGLSSHLEGLFNGILLMVLGLMWGRLALGRAAKAATFAAAIYGAYANWAATLISAATGAAAMMPIAGGGRTGGAAEEALVGFLLISLSLAMIFVALMVLWGLRRNMATLPAGE